VNAPCLVGSVSVDVNAPQRLLYAGTHLNLRFPNIENWADTRFNNSYALLTKTGSYFVSESLPGRGMLIPLPVFNVIGLFDESHFQHHMADLDFSVSARKAGFQLVISAASVVHEYTDATGINVMRPMSLNQFWQALSATRSPINWKTRYHFALKQAPYTYLYFGLDMLRIIGGYTLRQVRGHLYALCNSSSFAKKMSP
jgi:GT2 family glycosyltransferase